jgi:cytochrome c oxidase cbb3-type subunit III
MKSLLRILTGLMLLVVIPIAIFAFFPKLADWANQQPWIQTMYMFLIAVAAFALFTGLDLLNRVNVYKNYVAAPEAEKQNFWSTKFPMERLGFMRGAIGALLLMALVMVLLVFNLMVLPKAPEGNWYLWTIKALGVGIAIGVLMLMNAVLYLSNGKKVILGIDEKPLATAKREKTWQDRLFQLRPSFLDAEVDLKEDFDGISELDNPPPPWFMFLFYGTIVFAGFYMVHYSILKNGPNPDQEYAADDAVRVSGAKAYLASHEGNVDETSVTLLTDKAKLADAGKLFVEKCAMCHGEKGEGKNGPNLTDDNWIHGNSIKEVFAVIKNGVLEKGMISWKDQISPPNMRAVASYVLSLRGTNPAGAKEPQGEKLEPKEKF